MSIGDRRDLLQRNTRADCDLLTLLVWRKQTSWGRFLIPWGRFRLSAPEALLREEAEPEAFGREGNLANRTVFLAAGDCSQNRVEIWVEQDVEGMQTAGKDCTLVAGKHIAGAEVEQTTAGVEIHAEG